MKVGGCSYGTLELTLILFFIMRLYDNSDAIEKFRYINNFLHLRL